MNKQCSTSLTKLAWTITRCVKIHSSKYIYIYLYCHPQTDCFVLSEPFSVARHVGRPKPGSKPIQLYVRLSLRPLGQQAYHFALCERRPKYLYTCTHIYRRILIGIYLGIKVYSVILLDINLKIRLIWCINCMGGITGSVPVA